MHFRCLDKSGGTLQHSSEKVRAFIMACCVLRHISVRQWCLLEINEDSVEDVGTYSRCQLTQICQQQHLWGRISWQKSCCLYLLPGKQTKFIDWEIKDPHRFYFDILMLQMFFYLISLESHVRAANKTQWHKVCNVLTTHTFTTNEWTVS